MVRHTDDNDKKPRPRQDAGARKPMARGPRTEGGITGKRCHGKVLSGSTAIAEALLEHAHVALVPGAAFLDEGFCRISYATSMENIEEGLRRIAAFVKELE